MPDERDPHLSSALLADSLSEGHPITEKGLHVAHRIVSSITRALGDRYTEDAVHFHAGADGPYVCDNPRCTSPGLDVR